jgi:peptidoglycan/xylan/chitin deacetylase (PgdA/CDA1 family)
MGSIEKLLSIILFSLALQLAPSSASSAPVPALTVVCWHDVRDNLLEGFAKDPDLTAIDTRDLIAQFELIRGLGYTPISLQQWLDGRAGKITLPDKPILLSFDDGYRSLHDKVLPLLRLFQFPAVAAIVSDWIVSDAERSKPGRKFVTQEELRRIQGSGLVEIASHSHDLHRGVTANPQGNQQPAANARAWHAGEYESDSIYQARVAKDLKDSANALALLTGQRPRAIVWPYGAYNRLASDAAASAGYSVAMGLEAGLNQAASSPLRMRRMLVETKMGLTDFARALIPAEAGLDIIVESKASAQRASATALELGTIRSLRVNLDRVFDVDPDAQEGKLSKLIEDVYALGVNVVMLETHSASEEETGLGPRQGAAYLPSRHSSLRADLMNRVSWQLRTRADVKVFAVLSLRHLQGLSEAEMLSFASELGRQVPMAGLVIEPQQERIELLKNVQWAAALAEKVRAYHPDLMTVFSVLSEGVVSDKAASLGVAFTDFDYLLLADSLASKAPISSDLHKLSRALPIDRVIIEAQAASDSFKKLAASPLRHFGARLGDQATDTFTLTALRPYLSTATRHNPRK